jgi:hypothetical protein
MKNAYRFLVGNQTGRDNLEEELGLRERIILKLIS